MCRSVETNVKLITSVDTCEAFQLEPAERSLLASYLWLTRLRIVDLAI
jgi:hypothetical protein